MAGQQEIKRPLLNSSSNRASMQDNLQIVVNRADLEKEHSLLIARLHLLRRQLGLRTLNAKRRTPQDKRIISPQEEITGRISG